MAHNDMGIRRPGASNSVAASATPASSLPIGPYINVARIAATGSVFYSINGTATTTNSAFLPAAWVDYVKVNPGDTISFVTTGGNVTATVTEMD